MDYQSNPFQRRETGTERIIESDIMTAVSKYKKEEAKPIARLRPGSFADWVSKETPRNRIQNWQIYYGDLLKQSWLGPGDWENNGIGPLLRNDIITYAVTQLPARFAKECRCRLFGSPTNRFAAVELLIIGYALWQPQGQIYFNPYTEDRRPMDWGEILDIESRMMQRGKSHEA